MRATLASLRDEIAACSSGGSVVVSYADYQQLFPPGEPNVGAREKARTFAIGNGCWFVIRPSTTVVEFVKRK
jgi:hypothetical protein